MGLTTKVYVLFNEVEYDKASVLKILVDECYPHDFKFGQDVDMDDKESYIDESDEIWLFGDCTSLLDYKYGIDTGCDFWQMG